MTTNRNRAHLSRTLPVFCLALLLHGCTSTQESWVPVYEEPRHRLAFDNEQVRILDVNLPPGYVSLYHKHELDTMYVTISGTQVWSQPLGGEKRDADVKTGDLRFSSDNHELPHIHRVGNVGQAPFHVIGVAVKDAPLNKGLAVSGDLSGLHKADERPNAGVYRITLQPGQTSGEHTHNTAFTRVYLSSGTLRHSSGESIDVDASDFLWHPGGVTHAYENAGTEVIEIVEVLAQ